MPETTKRIAWDEQGKRYYETGIDHGVLYPMAEGSYEKGVAWNGLTSVSESPEGAEVSAIYADNIKYLNLMSAEDFKGTIEAYTYPDEFAECDGSANLNGIVGVTIGQQTRKKFGICYRTKVGNDDDADLGYKIHIVYNCLASPSERSYETVNDSPEAITFSWEFSTTPVTVAIANHKPTANVIIDTTKFESSDPKIKMLEDVLYGVDSTDSDPQERITAANTKIWGSGSTKFDGNATLLTPDEIAKIFAA